MTTAILATETVVLVLLTIVVAGLLRSHGEILRRLHALDGDGDGADAATEPPAIATTTGTVHDIGGTGLDDDAMQLAIGGGSGRTLLAFLSSGCLTCRNFWTAFGDPGALGLPGDVRVIVVVKDAAEESMTALRELAAPNITVVMSSTAWGDYRVPGSPYFVLVDSAARRVRGEGTAATWEQVRRLLLQAIGDDRELAIDRELLAHGIGPGDPSLYLESQDTTA
jgi:hypothetical protein